MVIATDVPAIATVLVQPTSVPQATVIATNAPVVATALVQPQATLPVRAVEKPILTTPAVVRPTARGQAGFVQTLLARPVFIAIAPSLLILIAVVVMIFVRMKRDYA